MEKYIIIGLLAWIYIFGVAYVKQIFEDEAKRIDPKAKTTKWMLISAMLWPILLILSPFVILFSRNDE